MSATLRFFFENLPTRYERIVFGPMWLLWAALCLAGAGYLKRAWHWNTGYTRKMFHFLIFTTAAGLQWQIGTRSVCLFGAMTTVVLAYAVSRGDGHLLYEAIAREKDAPRRTWYIIAPYLATLVGGVLSIAWFGALAIVGFLVTGIGDAAGEPVGTRFGKHTYRVPAIRGVAATRSLEGSLAVFLVSCMAIIIALWTQGRADFTPASLFAILLIGFAAAACEAVSPHGWDNLTMQLVPTALASWLLVGE
jgi:phytol kinase